MDAFAKRPQSGCEARGAVARPIEGFTAYFTAQTYNRIAIAAAANTRCVWPFRTSPAPQAYQRGEPARRVLSGQTEYIGLDSWKGAIGTSRRLGALSGRP